MSNGNLSIWDAVKQPPKDALKTIKGGRLKGMTDISPQWRYQVMTEVFGPCGLGWKYTVNRLWTEKGVGDEVMAFADVSLYVSTATDTWSEAIPGIGGSAMVALESSGPRASDECYKMAITDALSVAMKMLGVGADIYMGKWDGSKYAEPIPEGKGVIKPTDGAMARLTPEQQDLVRRMAEWVNEHMDAGDVVGAYEGIETANFDADHKVAMWSLITRSDYRAALKKQAELAKGK